MAYGFIYYLTNPSMPGLTKIGQTSRHPRERLAELSKATACPEPFEMLAFFDVVDAQHAEHQIHRELAEFRLNGNREFFSAPYGVLQNVARSWIDLGEGCCNTVRLDQLADEEEVAEIRAYMESISNG